MEQDRKIIGVVVLAIVKELVATAYRTEDKSASERIPLISSIIYFKVFLYYFEHVRICDGMCWSAVVILPF